MDWKTIITKFFELFGAYEPKARAFIVTLICLLVAIPYFMYAYNKQENEQKEQHYIECQTEVREIRDELNKTKDQLLNEVKDNKNEIVNLLKEVNFIKAQMAR
jgi:uncharacterized protein YlxW (UPF0749 family)